MDLEEQAQGVRADLKVWEHLFAKKNNGAKPGRNDIKQDPDIAKKYKLYNKLRDLIAGKSKKSQPSPQKRKTQDVATVSTPSKRQRIAESPRKRRPEEGAPSYTPLKRQRTIETPSNHRFTHPNDIVTPSTARKLFSPVLPTSIGPTPQRDGRVLGLFDNLEPTPQQPSPIVNAAALSKTQATPSKSTFLAPPLGRTPSRRSDGKLLSTPLKSTPLKERDANNIGGTTPCTSKSAQFATPSFLRRAPPSLPVDENGEFIYSPMRRARMMPRKPPVRGLSSVVAGLRKLEEEKLDDDLDMLREMEAEECAGPKKIPELKLPGLEKGKKLVEDKENEAQANGAVVEDSQVKGPQLLGGFDDEGKYDSEPEQQLGRDGAPLRVYKKKGQKRTTRRSNMKPVFTKRPKEQEPRDDDDEDDSGDDIVLETQYDATKTNDGGFPDLLSGSEFGGGASDDDDEAEQAEKAKKKKKPAPKKTAAKKGKDADATDKKEGVVKKAVRKISATAHQNFKRLKLRNHGAKGGPGYNSRFRRRR